MRRIVFLTNSDHLSNPELTKKTTQNFISFFKNSYGGYWNDDEFIFLNHPEIEEFEKALQFLYDSVEYTIFIALTPIKVLNDEMVMLYNKNNDYVSLNILKQYLQNGLIVMDDHSKNISPKTVNPFKESIYAFMLNRFDCATFINDKNIKETPKQIISIYSLNSPVTEKTGSLFCNYFLEKATAMVKEKIVTTDFFSTYSFIRIPFLFDETKKILETNNIPTKGLSMQIDSEEEINNYNGLVFTIIC